MIPSSTMCWIKLTDAETGKPVHVNMTLAISIETDEEHGTFVYIGQYYDDGNGIVYRAGVWVEESADEVLRLTLFIHAGGRPGTCDSMDMDLICSQGRDRSHWEEHPDRPVKDWQYEVANDDTRQGYAEWASTH